MEQRSTQYTQRIKIVYGMRWRGLGETMLLLDPRNCQWSKFSVTDKGDERMVPTASLVFLLFVEGLY